MHETVIATEPERAERPEVDALCTAELAECTCPDFCERDHDNE
jgi:hypothetical protein